MRQQEPFLPARVVGSDLEVTNQEFWRNLLHRLRLEVPKESVESILDVGCDRGGLLDLLVQYYHPHSLYGIEPINASRQQALFRLRGRAERVLVTDVKGWGRIPTAGVDLVVSHEVIHLVESLDELMGSLSRVLRPGGSAYVVTGCHTENPLWPDWRARLNEFGYTTFEHAPLEVMATASSAGLSASVRPLRRDGWVRYDPGRSLFHYPSASEMMDHHYRHKLLFRLDQVG